MRSALTYLSHLEIALSEIRSLFGLILVLMATIWLGMAIGTGDFWQGNPLVCMIITAGACNQIWGLPFLVLNAFLIYKWVFSEAPRLLVLSLLFISHLIIGSSAEGGAALLWLCGLTLTLAAALVIPRVVMKRGARGNRKCRRFFMRWFFFSRGVTQLGKISFISLWRM